MMLKQNIVYSYKKKTQWFKYKFFLFVPENLLNRKSLFHKLFLLENYLKLPLTVVNFYQTFPKISRNLHFKIIRTYAFV